MIRCDADVQSTGSEILQWCLVFFLSQGNQEGSSPADAMAQTYTPQYAPQNGIPAEFNTPHALPTQDYTGQNRVPDHGLTIYTPPQTHGELPNGDSNTPAISSSTNTTTVCNTHTHTFQILQSQFY